MTSTFTDISPVLAATQSAGVLREEVLRRMEVYALETLHDLLTFASPSSKGGPAHSEQDEKDSPGPSTAAPAFNADAARHVARDKDGPMQAGVEQQHDGDSTRTTPPSSEPAAVSHGTLEQASSSLASAESSRTPRIPLRTLHTTRHRLLVLAVLFGNVRSSTVATQRDVYYHLVRHVQGQAVVNRTVLQLTRVLRVPRQLLGVSAGVRGFVAGCVSYRGESLTPVSGGGGGDGDGGGRGGWGGAVVWDRGEGCGYAEGMPLPLLSDDLVVSLCQPLSNETPRDAAATTTAAGSWTTSGESAAVVTRRAPLAGFQVSPNVCAILVIEKHAVFAQLLREGLPRLLPCVLLTSQGFPTHAARRLVSALHAALPRAAVVGLVDYNPHGLAILAAYRWPSPTAAPMSLYSSPCSASEAPSTLCDTYEEVRHYALPALRLLGVRGAHVARLSGVNSGRGRGHPASPSPVSSAAADALPLPLQPFTHRDAVVLRTLTGRLEAILAALPPASTATSRAEHASVRAWLDEAKEMTRLQVKCELEVLYTPPHATRFVATVSDAGVGVDRCRGDHRLPPRQFAEWVKEQLLRRAYC